MVLTEGYLVVTVTSRVLGLNVFFSNCARILKLRVMHFEVDRRFRQFLVSAGSYLGISSDHSQNYFAVYVYLLVVFRILGYSSSTAWLFKSFRS